MATMDFSHRTKIVRAISPVDITAVANAVGEPLDTKNWLGLNILLSAGALTDFVATILIEESDSQGGVYTDVARLVGSLTDGTFAADSDDKVAQIGVLNVKRWVRLTVVVDTASAENLISAVYVLFAPQKASDTTATPPSFA